MLFVYLHVLTNFHLAMSAEDQFTVEYDFRWAVCLGDTTIQVEHLAPEHGCVYYFP